MSARHFEIIKRPGLIVPEAALRRRSICYSGSKPPTLTFADSASKSSTNGTHTYTGINFGPAANDRALFALLSTNVGTDEPINLSIGGVSATRQVRGLLGTGFSAEIFNALVPSGTSGSVVISGPSGSTNWTSSIGIYSATGLRSLTATDTDTDNTHATLSTSVSVEAHGFVLSIAFETFGTPTDVTFSGVTKDYFKTMQSGSSGAGGGSFVATGAITQNITAKIVGGNTGDIAATASFR